VLSVDRLSSHAWRLEVDAESPQFHYPLGNTSSGIPIVEYYSWCHLPGVFGDVSG
jgi:hypothetical protein